MSSNIKSNTRTAKTRTNDKTRPARQTDAANSQQGRRDGGGGVLSSSSKYWFNPYLEVIQSNRDIVGIA